MLHSQIPSESMPVYGCPVSYHGFPGGSDGKESACNAEDLGSIPGLGGSDGRRHGNPLQYSCLDNPQGQRSMVDYGSWDHKELVTTEATKHSTQHSILSYRHFMLVLANSLLLKFRYLQYLDFEI